MLIVAFFLVYVWYTGVYNFGYLIAAKILGYSVTEFAVGFGTRLAGFTFGNTRFELRAILFGGFVRIDSTERTLKFLTLTCCGPLTLILLSFCLTCGQLVYGFQEVTPQGALIIESSHDGGGTAHLRGGDIVIMAGGEPVRNGVDFARQFNKWEAGDMPVVVFRNGAPNQFGTSLPESILKEKRVGVTFRSLTETKSFTLPDAIKLAPAAVIRSLVGHIAYMGASRTYPLALAALIRDKDEFIKIAIFMAIFLGVVNLLPIPTFPGAIMLTMVIELILRRPLNENFKERLMQVGLVFLLLIMIFVLINDGLKILGVRDVSWPDSQALLSFIEWSRLNYYWSV